MFEEVLAFLVLIAAAHGLGIAVLLLRRSRRYLFLAGIILLLSFDLGTMYIFSRELEQRFVQLYFVELVTPFLYGPLLFLFARELAGRAVSRRDVWHFLPALLLWAITLPDLWTGFSNPEFFRELYGSYNEWDVFFRVLLNIQIPAYLLAFLRLPIPEDPGGIKGRRLNLILFALIWSSVILESAISFFYPNTLGAIHLLLTAASVAVVYLVGTLSLRGDIPGPSGPKYAKTRLEEDDLRELVQRMQEFMTNETLYTDPDLSLEDFAGRLDVPPHRVSQALNRGLDRNFFRFVNDYRVRAVQAALVSEDYRDQTVLEIALRCGFNSKASFNSVFKQHTGVTPSAYRKAHFMRKKG